MADEKYSTATRQVHPRNIVRDADEPDDIVERLRGEDGVVDIPEIMREAADEIERLRAALAQYGDHLYECEIKNGGACSCGYERALEQNARLDQPEMRKNAKD